MRHILIFVCLVSLSVPSIVPAQVMPYPQFFDDSLGYTPPLSGRLPTVQEYCPLGNVAPQAGCTSNCGYADNRWGEWQQQRNCPGYPPLPPRDSAYTPNRVTSYESEVLESCNWLANQPRALASDPGGPPPGIDSSSLASLPPSGQPSAGDSNPPGNSSPPSDSSPPTEMAGEAEAEPSEPGPEDLDYVMVWYQPSTWFDSEWDKTIELGLNGSGGNSETISFRVGGKAERETDLHKFLFEIVHNRAESAGVSTQDNVLGKLRFDRKLDESRWSLFVQGTGEYDEFKAFDVRLACNLGVNYKFITSESTTLAGDFGSGVSREIGGPDDSYVPEAVLGLDFKHQLSKRQKVYLKSEYYPDWGDFHSYRVVTDTGWELLLDDAWNLNLKIGIIDRYDSTPNGRRPNDVDYSVLLLWKL